MLTFHFLTGLVVPDVPLEETEILRKEAVKYNIELVISFSRNGCIDYLNHLLVFRF